MAQLAEVDPVQVGKWNRVETAAELAADLAGYVGDVLARARLREADRRRLVDLEAPLRLRAGDLERNSELVPYDDDDEPITTEIAAVEAERLRTGGRPVNCLKEVAEWSPSAPLDEFALAWFEGNLFRIIDADYQAWRQDQPPSAPQEPRRRRLGALSRR